MPITCPICRAANDAGPTCRRCRADLALIFAVERQRLRELAMARQFAAAGRWEEALVHARHARELRGGVDIERILAALNTQIGQFAAAWRHFEARIDSSAAARRDQIDASASSAAR